MHAEVLDVDVVVTIDVYVSALIYIPYYSYASTSDFQNFTPPLQLAILINCTSRMQALAATRERTRAINQVRVRFKNLPLAAPIGASSGRW